MQWHAVLGGAVQILELQGLKREEDVHSHDNAAMSRLVGVTLLSSNKTS